MKHKKFYTRSIGLSELGQAIQGIHFEAEPVSGGILILAGVHGDEIEGTWVANEIVKLFCNVQLSDMSHLTVVSCANPDGALLDQRWNSNGVDLNRNLPTPNWQPVALDPRYPPGASAASESETKAFLEIVRLTQPKVIVSLHSYSKSLVLAPRVESDLLFRSDIETLATRLQIPLVDKMDYKVFGSLTAFGKDQDIISVTIELSKGLSRHEVLAIYSVPIFEFIRNLLGRL